jgi:hypothetical protein
MTITKLNTLRTHVSGRNKSTSTKHPWTVHVYMSYVFKSSRSTEQLHIYVSRGNGAAMSDLLADFRRVFLYYPVVS